MAALSVRKVCRQSSREMPVCMQARNLANRTYKGPAVSACKTSFCAHFPEAFHLRKKCIIKDEARKLQGTADGRYRTGVGNENNHYGEERYRLALLQAFSTRGAESHVQEIRHITVSQLALMEMVVSPAHHTPLCCVSWRSSTSNMSNSACRRHHRLS